LYLNRPLFFRNGEERPVSSPKFSALIPYLFAGTIVGERRNDDLPCFVCEAVGGILILEVEGLTYDLCEGCANKAKTVASD
jgi:hypothetical protein